MAGGTMRKKATIFLGVAVIAVSWNKWSLFTFNDVVSDHIYSFEVVNEFPHDPNIHRGFCMEEKIHYSSQQAALDTRQLGKWIFGLERLYQITYKDQFGFIYDRYNLSNFERFTHDLKEGWGLASNGKVLFATDGSSSLYHIDPQTMKVISAPVVKYKGHEVCQVNELEYINNEIWANVSPSNCIARISPVNGAVIGWIVLPELREGLVAAGHKINVLNGIAWDKDKKRLFVTGKLWPMLYEVKLQPLRKPLQETIEHLCLNVPFPSDCVW